MGYIGILEGSSRYYMGLHGDYIQGLCGEYTVRKETDIAMETVFPRFRG